MLYLFIFVYRLEYKLNLKIRYISRKIHDIERKSVELALFQLLFCLKRVYSECQNKSVSGYMKGCMHGE